MAGEQRHKPDRGRRGARTMVEDRAGRRPFMRGIMVHSLTSRGLSFDEAVGVANAIRDEIRDLDTVTRKRLAERVRDLVGRERLGDREARVQGTLVVGENREMPFSKGFLSQSLLAAAIDPSDAFEVAREIEEDLIRREVAQVERRELRRLAFEALGARVGTRAAERYLVWRHYQEEPERPVILLLGGTTGAGKTSLAVEVAHRLGIARVVSTDSIRQVMRIMLSPELVPTLHTSSYDAHTVASEPDIGVVEGFRSQVATVSVGVQAMIDRAVSENENLILDGVSIVPGALDLERYVGRAEVLFLMVAAFGRETFARRFATRGAAARERPPHRYLENLDQILAIQDHLLEVSEAHQVPIVENESFDRSVLSIIRTVTESLRERSKLDVASLL